MVYLHSEEQYFPSDIGAQVQNTRPELNMTSITGPQPLSLDNLDQLNQTPNSSNGQDIYLTSTADPTTSPRPGYLYGVHPNPSGLTPNATSCAIVTVDRGNSTLDAFYFYFYAFNFGGVYFGLNVGNHVGDWEHNMIRFVDGAPSQLWYSQHSSGEAFTYAATQKFQGGDRPVTYSANGTHANYATPGTHDHTIPGINLPEGPIEDFTDAGSIWDPTLNAYYYSYSPDTKEFSAYGAATPTAWLEFVGRWGDEQYAESDPRQSCVLGISELCEYSSGPTGPEDKDLVREKVCPDSDDHCVVYPVLVPRGEGWEQMFD